MTGCGAVVFDLFHTLVDPEEHRPRDFDRLGEAARIVAVDPDHLRNRWEEWVPDLLRSPFRPAALIVREAGRDDDPSLLAVVDDIIGRYQDAAILAPEPEVLDALRELRKDGVRLGLLSNAHERDVRAWDGSPLAPLFDVAGFSFRFGTAKPEPDAYRRVLEELGVDADHAAFVGDGNGGELHGAHRAGFGLVVCVTGPALRSGLRTPGEMAILAAEADVAVDSVAEIPGLLRARPVE
jgi:HAD superfamily hydrolase (TIGR01509 family)